MKWHVCKRRNKCETNLTLNPFETPDPFDSVITEIRLCKTSLMSLAALQGSEDLALFW